jgi:hypothetical protein
MRKFKVICDHCEGTGDDGSCDWCNGCGELIVKCNNDDIIPLGAYEEIFN